MLLKGIGELHIEIIVEKLRSVHNINVYIGKAYVAYRESTIQNSGVVIKKSHKYDRTINFKRLFAIIHCTLEPLTTPSTTTSSSANQRPLTSQSTDLNTSSNTTSNTTSPSTPDPSQAYLMKPVVIINKDLNKLLSAEEYTSLHDGAHAALSRGPNGYPIVGVKLTIHNVERDNDTTGGAIRACIATCIDSIFRTSGYHQLLEPIMSVEIDIPTQYVGIILSDMTVKRRGEVVEVITEEEGLVVPRSILYVHVPLATMLGYATAVRSMTQV